MQTSTAQFPTVREQVLLDLARRDKTNLKETFRSVTESVAVVLGIPRVSIWELVAREDCDGGKLVCKDLYCLGEGSHPTCKPTLCGREFPAYLRAIRERRTITADDARHDPRTFQLTKSYLEPLGISSMMDVPIWHHGDVYGVLCFEQVGALREWQSSDEFFAIHTADIASLSLEAAELATLRRRWEAAVGALEEGVFVLDSSGKMIQYNAAAGRIYFDALESGLTFAERTAAFDVVDAEDRRLPPVDWPTARSLRGEVLHGEIIGLVIKRTGARRFLRLSQTPFSEDGAVKYIVSCCADITDEVFFSRLKRDLLSGLAHELKTPLAIAKGNAEQLQYASLAAKQSDRMLSDIVGACDRMDHLGETLLDLSSIMLGRLRLTRERLDLAELVRTVVRRANRTGSHEVEVTLAEQLLPPLVVVGDQVRIVQAIRQVIDNAMAFSSAGSKIEVTLSTGPEGATVAVRDHGVGIPTAAYPNVFTLFFKAHDEMVSSRNGLGIGLYLAREIIQRHHGEIRFESVEGEGSTFYITLPLSGEPADLEI
jgi:signal transduction histidine kinase